MFTLSPDILSAMAGALVAFLVSGLVLFWWQRRKTTSAAPSNLQEQRRTAYQELWELTAPLSWFSLQDTISDDHQQLIISLNAWHFRNGNGMVLTDLVLSIWNELMLALMGRRSLNEIRLACSRLQDAIAFEMTGRGSTWLLKSPNDVPVDSPGLISEKLGAELTGTIWVLAHSNASYFQDLMTQIKKLPIGDPRRRELAEVLQKIVEYAQNPTPRSTAFRPNSSSKETSSHESRARDILDKVANRRGFLH
jgi:hypothetical protein